MKTHVLLVSCFLWLSQSEFCCAKCPWADKKLVKWSEAWGKNVPDENTEVSITERILLDVNVTVATITIEPEGELVWDNEDNLELNTHYIWVKGGFHIGSEDCRFTKNARIRLLGRSNDKYLVEDHEFNRKFIGVAPKGVLELHGRKKTSWTKLAQTVKPVKDIDCAMVYNHNNPQHNRGNVVNTLGLNVIVWNKDGSQMDIRPFKDSDIEEISEFFASVPDGTVVGMFSNEDNGLDKKKASVEPVVAGMGAAVIKNWQSKQGYAFLARKGSKDTVVEAIWEGGKAKKKDKGDDDEEWTVPPQRQFLQIVDKDEGLVFQVATNIEMVRGKEIEMFRVLKIEAAFPTLTLKDEVEGWEEGDEVLLTSTDFNWREAETRKIIDCPDCSKRQIRVDAPFHYLHYGNFTHYVDERGEVAMLSRGIVIEGVVQDECSELTKDEKDKKLCKKYDRDTFGGHLMMARGFEIARIRGVKLLHLGQQHAKGHYSVHFHMCDEVDKTKAYVRENTVHDSFSRCFTVHGTNGLEVKDNVCYKHLGHGLFLEDGVEQNNTIDGNLICGTMHGTLLHSDTKKDWCSGSNDRICDGLASFWLTHPNNDIKNNVGAGGDGLGYMYIFADKPLGPSAQRQEELNILHHPKDFPLRFSNNVAHSYRMTGVHMDEKISTGTDMLKEKKEKAPENAILRTENEYDPKINGKPVWTEMKNGTYYKNGYKNMWVKGGNIRISFSALADSREGFTGGTTLFESGTEVYKSIFIGETDNKGNVKKRNLDGHEIPVDRCYFGDPRSTMTGVSLYQGPVIVKDCFFDRYDTTFWCLQENVTVSNCKKDQIITRFAGAISFKHANTYPTMTSSYAEGNTFGFCDNEAEIRHWVFQGADGSFDWEWKDGNKAVYLRDKDGHLTGTPNASIVPNYPLFLGDECQHRLDWGDLWVCPYRYVKLEILGKEGSLEPDVRTNYPLIIKRDDKPYDEDYLMMGEIRNEFLLRTHRSYMINFNETTKKAGFPTEMKLFGYGVEKGDEIRVGICQPKTGTSYELKNIYTTQDESEPIWVETLKELDAADSGKVFFHDKENGILFFKMVGFKTDTNETQRCPAGECWGVKVMVTATDSVLGKMRTCPDVIQFTDSTKRPKKPKTPDCPGKATPEGLGPVDWNNPGFIMDKEFSVPCKNFKKKSHTRMGCYAEKKDTTRMDMALKENEKLSLQRTMTSDFCVDRCYYRGYMHAGLSRGSRCTCSNNPPNDDLKVSDSACSSPCDGNVTQNCGSGSHVSVWRTSE